jgi:hypothetical protein
VNDAGRLSASPSPGGQHPELVDLRALAKVMNIDLSKFIKK